MAESLAQMARQLDSLVARFRLTDGSAAGAGGGSGTSGVIAQQPRASTTPGRRAA